MKITHPVPGYDGVVATNDSVFRFLGGEAHDTNIPAGVRKALEDGGFKLEDDRKAEAPADKVK